MDFEKGFDEMSVDELMNALDTVNEKLKNKNLTEDEKFDLEINYSAVRSEIRYRLEAYQEWLTT